MKSRCCFWNQLRGQIERGARNRTEILDARDGTSTICLEQKLGAGRRTLELARAVGDAVCAVFFHNDKPRHERRRGCD